MASSRNSPAGHLYGQRRRGEVSTVFQFAAEVGRGEEGDAEEVFAAAVRVVVKWLSRKFPRPLPSTAYNLGGFELDHLGLQHIVAVSLPSLGVWSARLGHPDAPYQGQPAVAGRTWTTEMALQRRQDGVRLAMRVQCASAEYVDAPVVLSRPGVVGELARQVGLRDIRQLDGVPWVVETGEELTQLYELLVAPERTLPVVLLTQPVPGVLWGEVAPYLLDHGALARQCLGIAHVVCMPAERNYKWTDLVSRPWSAFAGTVRTYQPGLDLENDSPFSHPLTLAERVVFWAREELKGEEAFAAFLVDKLQRQANTRPLKQGRCLFLADARARQKTLERERIERELGADQGIADRLRAELESLRRAHNAELAAQREQVAELAEAWDVALEWAEAAERERDRAERLNYHLRTQNTALRLALEAKLGSSADAETPIPAALEELPDWVDEHLVGRLVLHPRALQGLKKARYENPALVYEALLLLAREYRNMRLGVAGGQEAWEARLQGLGLQCSRSISDSRAGEQGDTYFVNYPVGSKGRVFVEFHLRQGAAKDDRYCLRIYFFWEAESSQVVVAWLPSHLDTRAT